MYLSKRGYVIKKEQYSKDELLKEINLDVTSIINTIIES